MAYISLSAKLLATHSNVFNDKINALSGYIICGTYSKMYMQSYNDNHVVSSLGLGKLLQSLKLASIAL